MSHALHPAQIAVLKNRKYLPLLAHAAVRLAVAVTTWDNRRTSRRSLAKLTDHELKDIGLDYATAQAEASKPFWQV